MKNLFIKFPRWATSLYRTLRNVLRLHPVRSDHTGTHTQLPHKPRVLTLINIIKKVFASRKKYTEKLLLE